MENEYLEMSKRIDSLERSVGNLSVFLFILIVALIVLGCTILYPMYLQYQDIQELVDKWNETIRQFNNFMGNW